MSKLVRVAAVNDYDLIVDGLATLLHHYPDRLIVCDRIVVGEPITDPPIDIALFDTYGRTDIAGPLRALVSMPDVRRVAIFSLDLRPELLEAARAAGAAGCISKGLPGGAIADALVRIAHGEPAPDRARDRALSAPRSWPGRDQGLSERESEVLVLCARGLTNREIAGALYVGVETVKSHLRSVFAKLGLRNRVEAAAFVTRSGAFAQH